MINIQTTKKESVLRLPEWLKVKHTQGLHKIKKVLRSHGLITVCEEARCPNIGECFLKPSVTFMILGSRCTRNCRFCSIQSSTPGHVNPDEPQRIADAAKEMGLRHIVVTSVTRDDLADGGAEHFAKTVRTVRSCLPGSKIEILTPDFKGNISDLITVVQSRPDVYNHNVETVPRLYPCIRPLADYRRSLNMLRYTKTLAPYIKVKSGLMLGLGETLEEIVDVMKDLRTAGCDFVTIGQYLRPSKLNIPVVEYIRPEIFEELRLKAIDIGFDFVASAPLVRSSKNAEAMFWN
jgi:lipoic acid synthetase